MKTLKELFVHTLKDVYWAEGAIAKALPKVTSAVTNKDLIAALKKHETETKGQIETLKKVFSSIGEKAEGVKCDATAGLLKECDGVIEEAESDLTRNAGALAACQAVEHYEIARYGTLREWAKELGLDEAHTLLSSILDEEKAANGKLTDIAVKSVNQG